MDFAPVFEIEDSSILGESNYIYTVVTFTEDISDYADGFTFDVFLDGELYYGNMTPEVDEQYMFCDLTLDGPLDSGTYTVTVNYDGEALISESVDIDNTNSGWSGSGKPDSIEGDVFLCYADCTTAFENSLTSDGFDLELEGSIGIWFELTLSEDGEYLLTVDSATFGADLIDFFTENKDQLMMGFYGVTTEAELKAYEDAIGSDTYDVLESTTVQSFVSEYSDNYDGLTDYGTYTISGDTITFSSTDYEGFEGTLGDDMISIDTGDNILNDGAPLEFYPEG